jgi:predicted permease
LSSVIDSVLPVFLIMALGFLLERQGMITLDVRVGLNRIAYWVGLPVLLFFKAAHAQMSESTSGPIFWVVFTGMVVCIAAAYLTGWGLRLPAASLAAYVQASFRGNNTFVALPIILYAIASLPADTRLRLEGSAILALVPMVIVYNVVSVTVFVAHVRCKGTHPIRHMAKRLVTNPLIVAGFLGLAVNRTGWQLPVLLSRTCSTIGGMAFPVALLAIGSQLAQTRVGRHAAWALASSMVKVIAGPLVGYTVARWVGLGEWDTRIALVLLAAPTAVASYVLADQLGGDSELAAGGVVVSTLLSLVSLGGALLVPL